MNEDLRTELCVVGGGAGGFATALAAARMGVETVLVEAAEGLGGTSTRGGVHCWEHGAGGDGLPRELYARLALIPDAVGIYSMGRHCCWGALFPGGESLIDPARTYDDTLRRHGSRGLAQDESFCRTHWHGVVFEPAAMAHTMDAMLQDTGCVNILYGAVFQSAETSGDDTVTAVRLADGRVIRARWFVDATGNVTLSRAVGCKTLIGQDGRDRFDEPDAPEVSDPGRVNGVTLLYRVAPHGGTPAVEPLPSEIPAACWWAKDFPYAAFNQYPCGDWNINTLPTMEGGEYLELGAVSALAECRRRIRAHWHWLQEGWPEFRAMHMRWVAPMLGVREGPRVVAEYMLTERDLLNGVGGQTHPDIIATADHAMDTHGVSTGRAGCGELAQPYGIPFRCLIPKGWRNLLVACRGAGFSSLAASSCRLTRTILQIGAAAGTAVGLAREHGCEVGAIRRMTGAPGGFVGLG